MYLYNFSIFILMHHIYFETKKIIKKVLINIVHLCCGKSDLLSIFTLGLLFVEKVVYKLYLPTYKNIESLLKNTNNISCIQF